MARVKDLNCFVFGDNRFCFVSCFCFLFCFSFKSLTLDSEATRGTVAVVKEIRGVCSSDVPVFFILLLLPRISSFVNILILLLAAEVYCCFNFSEGPAIVVLNERYVWGLRIFILRVSFTNECVVRLAQFVVWRVGGGRSLSSRPTNKI